MACYSRCVGGALHELVACALACGAVACATGEDVSDTGPSAGGSSGSGGSGMTSGSDAAWQGGAGGGGSGGSAGASSGGGAGAGGGDAGGADSGPTCGPEICNGADDDCNGTSDDGVCGVGCSGAVYQGRAYMFCNTSLKWSAAVADCTANGMVLVRIDDAGEQSWLRTTATARGLGGLWIGGSDAVAEGQWLWPDGAQFWSGGSGGSAVGGLYANWASGEPNDDGTEDCAAAANDGKWVDSECGNGRDYVCEL